ncbi:zinc finger HIT domain-containing protein 1-like [Xenia sp. Carnegie-2017]|uniref:zinc finger HIT domain-containing protein 1-like n=1 Tax=Xenia sp. Carnegie-2017 TaxID=2897299 RepID=UPI001F04339F|nr:zinc finger HIT domain-containing protein 1-like [Xenia sp. Carnegie-2017]
MPEKSSARQKAQAGRRVLDEYARKRRRKRQLDALEMDNFGDDPHANLAKGKKLPSFIDSSEEKKKKRKKGTGEHFKQRFKKTFALLLEEEKQEFVDGEPNYVTACVPPSRFPERHFCSVCGFPSNYTCVQCGARYCSVKCLGTHKDTRCLKWTA